MCGRITQISNRMEYIQALGPTFVYQEWSGGDIVAQYNVAPGAQVTVIEQLDRDRLHNNRIMWGYRTPWSKEQGHRPHPNSRIEKSRSPYIRHMWKSGRVLVPVDGWYEWTGEKASKQPWYFRLKTNRPMFMAAITNFRPREVQTVEVGLAIITTAADGALADIHDRRPIVLSPEHAQLWVDKGISAEQAEEIAHAGILPPDAFEWYPVSKAVNRVVNMMELSVDEQNALITPIELGI